MYIVILIEVKPNQEHLFSHTENASEPTDFIREYTEISCGVCALTLHHIIIIFSISEIN